jgi:hypothetical protein
VKIYSPRYERKITKSGALSSPPRRRAHVSKAGALPSSGLLFFRARHNPQYRTPILNPISSRYWNNLLRLLWFVLWADGKPCARKSKTFIDEVVQLKHIIEPKAAFDREDIVYWREIHEMPRRAFIRKLNGSIECKALSDDIRDGGHALDVLTSMVQIAISDGIYTASEAKLIKRTILLWEISEKTLVDINYAFGEMIVHID